MQTFKKLNITLFMHILSLNFYRLLTQNEGCCTKYYPEERTIPKAQTEEYFFLRG